MSVIPIIGQKTTFNRDVAPIIHRHCSTCHKPNSSAPFSLITYNDVATKGQFIKHVTSTQYMPPWYADTAFSHFSNERGLSQKEIQVIAKWVDSGMAKGRGKIKPLLTKVNLDTSKADLQIGMNASFTIPGNRTEQYRFFVAPSRLSEPKYISKIQFKPGNLRLVHHSRIMTDTTNLLRPIDGISEFDPALLPYRRIPLEDEFLFGWVPGNRGLEFPPGIGKRLNPQTDFIFNIHYAPTALAEVDSSGIEIYFHESPIHREVQTLALEERSISNPPFEIPADTVKTFYMRSAVLDHDISVISILPHMHLLGQVFKAYAITPDGDLVPLIHIRNWNFDWQETYQFSPMLHIPKGSVIYAEATYNNTSSNLRNPFSPPRLVKNGWNTTDEMFNLVLFYVAYQQGDESWGY